MGDAGGVPGGAGGVAELTFDAMVDSAEEREREASTKGEGSYRASNLLNEENYD